ncbi:MAG TPA: hypothetical protein VLY04_13265 [Bryobacteraceae bacterium]|nr:hypothetical protein [Bryobacteraceae bacterium]
MLKYSSVLILIGILTVPCLSAWAASECDELQVMKSRVYGFHPGTLNDEQRKSRSDQMDAFWAAVKSRKGGGACLRQMLADERRDGFFLYDAAQLLLSLEPIGANLDFLRKALMAVDLADVQPAQFVRSTLRLAHAGYDTGPIAHHYMEAKDVTTYLPEHGAYKLDRVAGAILLYGSMDPVLADRYLALEAGSASSETRDAAVIVWSMNLTEASFKGLAALDLSQFSAATRDSIAAVRKWRPVKAPANPKYTREELLARLASENIEATDEADSRALDESAYATLTLSDLDAFRAARRRLVRGVSNESVEGYVEMSRVLLGVINHLDAYAQYRTH